jgi:hypothetical protein
LKEIRVDDIDVNDTLDIVRALRAQGQVQGRDFDFSYHRATYDPVTGHGPIDNKHALFKFYDDKYATLFALRYAR